MARLGRGQPFSPKVLRPPAVAAVTVTGSGAFTVGVPTFTAQGNETFSATGAFTASVAFTGVGLLITSVTATGGVVFGAPTLSGQGSIPTGGGGGIHVGGERPNVVRWKGRIKERQRDPALAMVLAEDEEEFMMLLELTAR